MVSTATALIRAGWLQISKDPNHRDLWLCDETIHRRIRSLHPTPNVNRRAINCALLSVAGSHQKLNILGLYHVMFRTICPYSKQKRDVNYFYRYVRVEPSFPRIPSDVEDIIAKAFRLVEEREISSGDSEKIQPMIMNFFSEKETNPATINPETMNPEIPSDVEDIIAKAFRLVEEREISSGDSGKNTNNDDEKKKLLKGQTKAKK